MKIVIAKNAGYCFGVRDAVDLAYDISKVISKNTGLVIISFSSMEGFFWNKKSQFHQEPSRPSK